MPVSLDVRSTASTNRTLAAASDRAQPLCLTLRVGRHDGSALGLALSHALGHDTEVFVMARDAVSGCETLQILTCRNELDALMHVIMDRLPQAEFGYVQPLACAAVH
jgi:hypothetical protein